LKKKRKSTIRERILVRLLRSSIRDAALQDFDQRFLQIKKHRGTLIATLWFGVQVLSLIPSLLKDSAYWSTAMIKNYFKIAFRNIRRHKGYSFINIAGLAIGMACTILILIWIQDELAYDRFHEKGDNIYRVIVEDEQGSQYAGTCPIPLGPRAEQSYPEVLDSARLCNGFQKFLVDDDEAVIINQTLAQIIGAENLVGKKLYNYSEDRTRRIVGIVEDFHFESLHSQVKPLMIVPKSSSDYKFMYVKIMPGTIPSSLKFLKDTWKKFGSGNPFEYHFLDQTIDQLYSSEKRMGKIFLDFAFLAIFISCLGLFGLASFTAEQRTKEIGIRRVLGASAGNIICTLTIGFSKWVLAANVIAWPVAYFAMHEWLQNFAFKTDLGVWVFVLSAAASLAIAMMTVGYQSIRAALADPADSLRHE
jgi:hypothetical protein